MAHPPPVSSHSVTSSDNAPISPVTHTSTFTHTPLPTVPSKIRHIDTSTRAINAAPVEIDGAALSPDELSRRTTAGSTTSGVFSPADEDDEFVGEGGVLGSGRQAREKRAAILASRSKDPGVIVDVPQEPTADEVEAAKSADGSTTPGLEANKTPGGLSGR
ncbi:hypothetical protein ACN47E_009130 [Coniothyrium glycines]